MPVLELQLIFFFYIYSKYTWLIFEIHVIEFVQGSVEQKQCPDYASFFLMGSLRDVSIFSHGALPADFSSAQHCSYFPFSVVIA